MAIGTAHSSRFARSTAIPEMVHDLRGTGRSRHQQVELQRMLPASISQKPDYTQSARQGFGTARAGGRQAGLGPPLHGQAGSFQGPGECEVSCSPA